MATHSLEAFYTRGHCISYMFFYLTKNSDTRKFAETRPGTIVFASTTAIQSSLSAGKKRALQRIWHRPLKTFAAAAELKISLIAVMLRLMMMLIMIRLSFMKIAKLQPCPSGLVVWLVSWVCNGSRHRAPFYIK